MRKTLVHALIACALGVALGLLADGARAANVERPSVLDHDLKVWGDAWRLCQQVGGNRDICWIHHAPTELQAMSQSRIILESCDGKFPDVDLARECAAFRAYIKQRWGY